MPLGRDDQIDKAHEELAIAIIHSMWCGWLSQAKKNRVVLHKNMSIASNNL